MSIENYITLLTNYVKKQGISIYDYYYQLALKKRNIEEEGIPEFEAYNPFLKEEDYLKLISSKEEDICKYFALAMDKTISLNLGDKLTREDIENVINEKMNDNNEGLTRKDIEEVIIDEMNNENESLSRKDIEEVITDKMNEGSDILSRADIEEVITDKMNANNEGLTRADIENVITDKMNEDNELLSREDIINVIDESMLENETSLSGDASVSYTEEYEGTTVRNFVTTIGKKIAKFLNGFAVVKDDEKKKTDVYSYDAKNKQIRDRHTFDSDAVKANTGIYVNFQEYIDRMFESVLEQYPDADVITFVNDEGEEKPFARVVEEAFQLLKEAGSLRFGEELAKKQPQTYQEYFDMNVEGTSKYGESELQKGIYVRRDLLTEFFNHYYVRALYYEYYEEAELENVK